MLDTCSPLRAPMDLCGSWEMAEDRDETFSPYVLKLQNHVSRTAELPADIGTLIPERPFAEGVYWFFRTFDLPEVPADRRTVLHFDAVNYESTVFINDRLVGSHHDGFLPFEFEVTAWLRPGVNTLIVRVDTRRFVGQVPTSFFWRNVGGIIRDVYLYSTPKTYLCASYATAHADGSAELSVTLSDIPEGSRNTLRLRMTDPQGATVWEDCLPARSGEQKVSLKLDAPLIWSPDSPALYGVSVELAEGAEAIDSLSYRTGFRDIAARDGKILLNGAEIFLRGFNRHEDHPQSGGARSAENVASDFETVKRSGANFLRMCHYPHDERELDAADRLGILLLVEIPLCAYNQDHIGIADGNACGHPEKVFGGARRLLEGMIARDRSHPSVILWSVSNETGENRPDGEKVIRINNSLMEIARKLDPSRLAVHVSNHPQDPKRDTFYTEDDVICINIYPSIEHKIRGSLQNAVDGAAYIRKTIEELAELYPGKPLIVTEFGYRTGAYYDAGDDEENQAVSIVEEYQVIRKCAAGATVWLFADHLWPRWPSLWDNLSISRFGLLNRDRTPKKAFDAYSRCMKELG